MNRLPLHRPLVAYLFEPLFERWPRLMALAVFLALTALFGLAGDPPPDQQAAGLPDGIPAELLHADSAASAPQEATCCASL